MNNRVFAMCLRRKRCAKHRRRNVLEKVHELIQNIGDVLFKRGGSHKVEELPQKGIGTRQRVGGSQPREVCRVRKRATRGEEAIRQRLCIHVGEITGRQCGEKRRLKRGEHPIDITSFVFESGGNLGLEFARAAREMFGKHRRRFNRHRPRSQKPVE